MDSNRIKQTNKCKNSLRISHLLGRKLDSTLSCPRISDYFLHFNWLRGQHKKRLAQGAIHARKTTSSGFSLLHCVMNKTLCLEFRHPGKLPHCIYTVIITQNQAEKVRIVLCDGTPFLSHLHFTLTLFPHSFHHVFFISCVL